MNPTIRPVRHVFSTLLVVAVAVVLLIKGLPVATEFVGEVIPSNLSRVDRAIIVGCKTVLGGPETQPGKAMHLLDMHCERYSDREINQVEKDVNRCANNASKGDAELNRCLEAAQGY